MSAEKTVTMAMDGTASHADDRDASLCPSESRPNTSTGEPSQVVAGGQRHSIRYIEPIMAWLVSRIVCVMAMTLGAIFLPIADRYDLTKDNPRAGVISDLSKYYQDYAQDPEAFGQRPMIGLTLGGPWSAVSPLIHWDTFWYLSIVEQGYVGQPGLKWQQNAVFFPVFPMLVYLVTLTGVPAVVAGLIVANVCALGAVCLLYGFLWKTEGAAVARWTIALWLTYPLAFFSVVPYTEATMALMTVLVLCLVHSGRYAWAGACVGIAGGVRLPGILLGGPFVKELFSRRWPMVLVGICLSLTGLLAFMGYLAWRFDDPLYFVTIQKNFRPAGVGLNPLLWILSIVKAALIPLIAMVQSEDPWPVLLSARGLDPYLAIIAIALLPAVFRWHWGWGLTCLATLILPLTTGTVASLGRYLWVALPFFVVAGRGLPKSHWRWPMVVVSSLLLVISAFLFGGGWEMI